MSSLRFRLGVGAIAVAFAGSLRLVAAGLPAEPAESQASFATREAAYRENNLGVALLEQFRFGEAAEAFRRALEKAPLPLARVNLVIALLYVPDHDAARREAEAALETMPDSPRLNYVLGLIARGEGRAEDAVPYLTKVLARDPRDVGANLTLGQCYLQMRRFDEAVEVFRVAVEAEPYNVSAAYNLGVALNRAGRREEGRAALERFQELRDSVYKTSLGSTYLEQGKYAEALASTGAEAESVDPAVPPVTFVERDQAVVGGGAGPISKGPTLGTVVSPDEARAALPRAALVVADLDGDGDFDVVEAGVPALRLLRNDGGTLREISEAAGLGGIAATAVVAGDYDNDARPDLLVLRPGGLSLFRNDGALRFAEATSQAGVPSWPYVGVTAAFVDVDHDGDLDILVAGLADLKSPASTPAELARGFAPAPALLLQNDGDGSFTDVTGRARLDAPSRALAVIATDFDNRNDVDIFVLRQDAPPALLKNMRDGTFRDVAAEVGLAPDGPLLSAAAGDLNKDGFVDLFLGGEGPSWLALSDGRASFETVPAPVEAAGAEAAQLVDYDNDGLLDLFVLTAGGPRLLRNLGGAWSDVTDSAFSERVRGIPLEGAALGIADLDADGDQDAIVATPQRLRHLTNEGGNRNHSFAVDLAGRVSNKEGVGAKVEIRAGSLRQKLESSASVPMAAPADLVFGLGSRTAPDAVRVIWVSGIVQTETDFAAAATEIGRRTALGVMELDRKPSSCPYLYAWNGERFEFLTDFLGGGEMGYGVAPRVWNHPDPVEYVRITSEQLRPRDGRYELRVTNELEEALFLDRLRLLAVDHPDDVAVYPDEGMTVPPKAERLVAVRDPRVPGATDDKGRVVTGRIAQRDRVFVDDLPLRRIRGYARDHALTLDLGEIPETHTVLLLTGWTDYAFSSDNVAAYQGGLALHPPRLEVERAGGSWETAIEQIGVPVGRPQTVVADLGGVELGPSRRVRVVTSMRVYWDEVRVAAPVEGVTAPPVVLDPIRADLRERGFSAETSPDGAEPWSYDYARVSWLSPWKSFPGRYTRLGDVRPLLSATDDAFVISRPGDEIQLSFDAGALPAVRPGWARTFLLLGDGYSKEMDVNSASPEHVEPLPWHGMPSYPYDEGEVPAELQARWAELDRGWRTRRVIRPLVPLDLFASRDRGPRPVAGADD